MDYPAPWNLTGNGYILIYKFNESFVNTNASIPQFLNNNFIGGFGSVMFVDYTASNAGPYQELLFIPGKFKFLDKKLTSITKIYVSTNESVENGYRNWAIPKELANFKIEKLDKSKERISVFKGNEKILDIAFSHWNFKFPVNTALMPYTLVQEKDSKYFITSFKGKGIRKLAFVDEIQVNKNLFPDISYFKPIAVIKVENFKIEFPIPKII